jgi:hypothetical protein
MIRTLSARMIRSPRMRRWTWLLAAALLAMAPDDGAAQQDARPRCTETRPDTLEGRNCLFLQASGRQRAAFLTRSGTFTWAHTTNRPRGAAAGVWRFTGEDARRAMDWNGPLIWVFDIHVEGQPIGTFSHQVMHRGTGWRRVRGDRFVPPGAPDDSPVFVQWRREGGTWVVSAVGDESFLDGAPLPPWCC